MPFIFLKQSHSGTDSKLCAYFAYCHFTNQEMEKGAFISNATQYYMGKLGMSEADAKELAMGGNDPAIYGAFGLVAGDKSAVDKFEVLIVCNIQAGHFFTIRKQEGKWWSYDSYNYDKATLIGDDKAAKAICGQNPVYHN